MGQTGRNERDKIRTRNSNLRKEIVNNTFNSNDVFTSDVFEGEISESDIPF